MTTMSTEQEQQKTDEIEQVRRPEHISSVDISMPAKTYSTHLMTDKSESPQLRLEIP